MRNFATCITLVSAVTDRRYRKTKICAGEGRQLGSFSLGGFGFSAFHAV
jgi:hypothetical protein